MLEILPIQTKSEQEALCARAKIPYRVDAMAYRASVDGVITAGSSYIDNAALTGESVPVEVQPGDAVLSGGVNGSAKLELRVTSRFEDSTASRILRMIEESSARKGSAEKLITRFARVYTPIVLVLAILVAVLPPLFGLGTFVTWLYRALTMLVASCPCALVISVPLGFFAGIGVESKAGMLIKGGKYLEALAKADVVIMDDKPSNIAKAISISKKTLRIVKQNIAFAILSFTILIVSFGLEEPSG